MPVFSAINGDTKNIFPGAAIAGKSNRWTYDRVVLAGGSIQATAIALDGSIPGGVVRGDSVGVLSLNDWTLATGGKYLTPNAKYTLASNGKYVPNGAGQVIGIAASRTDLTITISFAAGTSTSTDTALLQAQIAAETAARIAADGIESTTRAGSDAIEAASRIAGDLALAIAIASFVRVDGGSSITDYGSTIVIDGNNGDYVFDGGSV